LKQLRLSIEVEQAHRSHERKAGRSRVVESKARNLYHRSPIYRQKDREKSTVRAKLAGRWWAQIKTVEGCQACGYNRYHGSLDVHHIDRSTVRLKKNGQRTTPGGLITGSLDVLRDECIKCVVLCKNCHYEAEAGLIEVSGLPRFDLDRHEPRPWLGVGR
jgi:hypothetical protein